jgi:hypothetical protein
VSKRRVDTVLIKSLGIEFKEDDMTSFTLNAQEMTVWRDDTQEHWKVQLVSQPKSLLTMCNRVAKTHSLPTDGVPPESLEEIESEEED